MKGIRRYRIPACIPVLSLIPGQKLNSAAEVARSVEKDMEYVNL
jgi:hypothetical protein